jgi:hypothetical protein
MSLNGRYAAVGRRRYASSAVSSQLPIAPRRAAAGIAGRVQLAGENHTKDIDFSPSGIPQRWEVDFSHTREVLEPLTGAFDRPSGVILHEHTMKTLVAAE